MQTLNTTNVERKVIRMSFKIEEIGDVQRALSEQKMVELHLSIRPTAVQCQNRVSKH